MLIFTWNTAGLIIQLLVTQIQSSLLWICPELRPSMEPIYCVMRATPAWVGALRRWV